MDPLEHLGHGHEQREILGPWQRCPSAEGACDRRANRDAGGMYGENPSGRPRTGNLTGVDDTVGELDVNHLSGPVREQVNRSSRYPRRVEVLLERLRLIPEGTREQHIVVIEHPYEIASRSAQREVSRCRDAVMRPCRAVPDPLVDRKPITELRLGAVLLDTPLELPCAEVALRGNAVPTLRGELGIAGARGSDDRAERHDLAGFIDAAVAAARRCRRGEIVRPVNDSVGA